MTKQVPHTRFFNTLVILSCQHILRYSRPVPKAKDELWCARCSKYRTVVLVPEEFAALCDRCTFSRQYGKDEHFAMRSARQHVTRRPTHTVEVIQGSKTVATITSGVTESLFDSVDEPAPF